MIYLFTKSTAFTSNLSTQQPPFPNEYFNDANVNNNAANVILVMPGRKKREIDACGNEDTYTFTIEASDEIDPQE